MEKAGPRWRCWKAPSRTAQRARRRAWLTRSTRASVPATNWASGVARDVPRWISCPGPPTSRRGLGPRRYCLGSDRARRRRHRRHRRCRLGQPPRLGWQAAAVKAPRIALIASLPAEVRDRSVVPTGVVPRRAVARAATALATRLPILRPARRACRCRRGPSWGESGRRRGGRGGRILRHMPPVRPLWESLWW